MNLLRKLLFPFAILYGFITSLRNYLYDKGILKSYSFDIPVIDANSVWVAPSLIAVHAEDLAAIARILRVVIAAKPSRETVAKETDSFSQTSMQLIGWVCGVIVVNTELLYTELMLMLKSTEQDTIM